jgi:alcohol dehydrogenase
MEFLAPTRIIIEDGGSARIGELLADRQPGIVLVVTDRGVQAAGLLEPVRASLRRAGFGVEEYADLRPNPRTSECDALARSLRGRGIGAVLAVGGGSAIDVAKAAALLLTHDGAIDDYVNGRRIDAPLLPIACIPTTAGTGSEVTQYAVLTEPQRRQKVCLAAPALLPVLAVLDGDMLASLPAPIIASTGMDALTHAIEAYTGRRANPISDALALHAIGMIGTHLELAVAGTQGGHRRQMLIASTLAGLAFGNADVAAVHCLSEALGGRYDWPHGVCNAMLLPLVFRHNAEVDPLRHATVGHALGINRSLAAPAAAEAAAQALAALMARLRIPRLSTLPGADERDIPALAAAAKANISDASNSRTMSVASYTELLTAAFGA